jgi:hypothetical protein
VPASPGATTSRHRSSRRTRHGPERTRIWEDNNDKWKGGVADGITIESRDARGVYYRPSPSDPGRVPGPLADPRSSPSDRTGESPSGTCPRFQTLRRGRRDRAATQRPSRSCGGGRLGPTSPDSRAWIGDPEPRVTETGVSDTAADPPLRPRTGANRGSAPVRAGGARVRCPPAA